MKNRVFKAVLALAFLLSVLLNLYFILEKSGRSNEVAVKEPQLSATSEPVLSSTDQKEELMTVTKVIDGDTVVLENGETVRYIGIDAPEVKGVECYSGESTAKNKELVEGKSVRLAKDVSERDRYGRLLRYVYVEDKFVNDALVREGYAKAATYPPDVKYSEQFRLAETEARENNRGLWSSCGNQISVVGEALSSSSVADKDCKDFITQAEAQEFFISQGGPASDPHKLDSDKDGKVCEGLP